MEAAMWNQRWAGEAFLRSVVRTHESDTVSLRNLCFKKAASGFRDFKNRLALFKNRKARNDSGSQ